MCICKNAQMNKDRAAYQAFVDYLCDLADVKSSSALARKAGFAPSTINRFLGETPVKHTLSTKTIEGLARAAGLSAIEAHQLLAQALQGAPLPKLVDPKAVRGQFLLQTHSEPRRPARPKSGGQDDENQPRRVPVVGYVGAGARVHLFEGDSSGFHIDEADAPPMADSHTVAVIVRGDSMAPAFRDHDTIYYRNVPGPPDGLLGRECVVGLSSGEVYVKILQRGNSAGLFNLFSYNAPLLEDQPVQWAVKVRWVDRGD